jgi:hypothetical protein
MRYPFDDPNIWHLLREAQRFQEIRERAGIYNRDRLCCINRDEHSPPPN